MLSQTFFFVNPTRQKVLLLSHEEPAMAVPHLLELVPVVDARADNLPILFGVAGDCPAGAVSAAELLLVLE